MRFTLAAATVMALATTVTGDGWRSLGGNLYLVGPSYNATFKAGGTIPLEYTFIDPTSRGSATLTTLTWVSTTGRQAIQVAFDNSRSGTYLSCVTPTDLCSGTYYPKRINLAIAGGMYPNNYTIEIGYTLSVAQTQFIVYRLPVDIVASTGNVVSPAPIFPALQNEVTAMVPIVYGPNSSGPNGSGSNGSGSNGSSTSTTKWVIIGPVIGVLLVLFVAGFSVWKRRANRRSLSKGGEEEREGGTGNVEKSDVNIPEPTVEHKGHGVSQPEANLALGQYEGKQPLGSSPPSSPLFQQQQQQPQQQYQQQLYQQHQFSPPVDQNATAEEQHRQEEIRRQIQQLQQQLIPSTTTTYQPYTPAPFQPSVSAGLPGSQGQFRENLQLLNHPKPNVVSTLQQNQTRAPQGY